MANTSEQNNGNLNEQVSRLQCENDQLKAELARKGSPGVSDETVDGILFVVLMFAVISGVVIWLSSMPS